MREPLEEVTPVPARLRELSILAVTASLLAAPVAAAQQATGEEPAAQRVAARSPSDEIPRLVAMLGDEDFHRREQATKALSAVSLSVEEIASLAPPMDTLTLEQWTRLNRALYQRFASTPRGGLGAVLDLQAAGDGVMLRQLVDTFPASGVLEPGDVVVEVDGQPLAELEDRQRRDRMVRAAILSRNPGESLPAVVRRRDSRTNTVRELEVRIPLGSYNDLDNAPNLDQSPDLLRAAWEQRRARLGLQPPSSQRINPPLSRANWPQGGWDAEADRRVTVLAGGGASESSLSLGLLQRLALVERSDANLARRIQEARPRFDLRNRGDDAPRRNTDRAEAVLRVQLAQLGQQIRRLETRLDEPGIDDRTREAIERSVNALRAQANTLLTQLRRLRDRD